MAIGDHIRVPRGLYWHHGIDLGDGTVAHSSGEPLRERNAIVKQTALAEFCQGEQPRRVYHEDGLPVDEVIDRAQSQIGRRNYHLLLNNCEHFATWCKTGRARSRQVERVATGATLAGYATRAAAGLVAARGRTLVLSRLATVAGPAGYALVAAGISVRVLQRIRRDAI